MRARAVDKAARLVRRASNVGIEALIFILGVERFEIDDLAIGAETVDDDNRNVSQTAEGVSDVSGGERRTKDSIWAHRRGIYRCIRGNETGGVGYDAVHFRHALRTCLLDDVFRANGHARRRIGERRKPGFDAVLKVRRLSSQNVTFGKHVW